MQILLITFCILLSIWIILIILLLTGVVPQIHSLPKEKSYDLFEYEYDQLCRGIIPNLNCSKGHHMNGNYYSTLRWKTSPSDYVCTVYITSIYVNEMWTDNWWITVYDKTNKTTAGTLRWSSVYSQPFDSKDLLKTTVPFIRSFITAGSHLLQKYQNATCVVDYRNNTRKIHIFTQGVHPDLEQEMEISTPPSSSPNLQKD